MPASISFWGMAQAALSLPVIPAKAGIQTKAEAAPEPYGFPRSRE